MNKDTKINKNLSVTYSQLEKDYIDNKMTIKALAIKYNCTYCQAKHLIEKAKIKKVTKVKINTKAFKTLSEENSYLAGFIAADGNIRKDNQVISLGTNIKDQHIHDLLKQYIGGNTHTYKYGGYAGGFKLNTDICSVELVRDIKNLFFIIPQKTWTLKFPILQKEQYIKMFMRGFFDGDGCITHSPGKALQVKMYCAAEDFIKLYVKNIEKYVKIKVPKLYNHPTGGKEITLNFAKSILFLHWLYSDRQDLALPRKLEKYLKWTN
jgi:DNA-binding transcriptional regulator WhiA